VRRINSPDIRHLIEVALTAAVVSIAANDVVLRAAAAATLVLFLPGCAVLRLLRPQSAFSLYHLVSAVGLSMALSIAGGFALHVLGAMSAGGWAVLLGAITVGAAVAADRVAAPATHTNPDAATLKFTPKQIGLLAASLIAVCFAFAVAQDAAIAHREFWASELWMVPRDAAPNAFTLGVRNGEQAAADYALELRLDGEIIASWPSIQLQPGANWTTEVNLPFEVRTQRRAEAWLFKGNDRGTVYRRVWADVGRS
jgi:hypothetical protein